MYVYIYILIEYNICYIQQYYNILGKTTILKRLLKFREDLFTARFNHIIYCYGETTSGVEDVVPGIELHQGFPSSDQLQEWIARYSSSPWMICVDDMSQEFHNSDVGSQICCKLSHHYDVSVVLVSHSLFQAGTKASSSRLISLNMHNFIFTRSLRDLGVYQNFGRQCLGNGCGRGFVQCFLDATEGKNDPDKPGYLVVTLHPIYSNRSCHLFTSIFKDEGDLIAYRI